MNFEPIEINLEEVLKDIDDNNLQSYDIDGKPVLLTNRVAMKWVLSSLTPEQHCEFKYLALINDILPQMKTDKITIDNNDTKTVLASMIQNCKFLTSLPKVKLLKQLKSF